ncbi:hypothetical protein AB833_03570 [Chromatiales bacterium (ex Bugula neritina AB1)]|nr:hypothetical protein AB833_03570 [Chromatiales bacterium (ex Bugula neritina AB1)]
MKSTELGILFIDITKTAGTAIKESFERRFPNYTFEGKHHSIRNFLSYGSPVLDDFGMPHEGTCSPVTTQELLNYHTFSVIRNPYDRMVSLWLWGRGNEYNENFNEFVASVAHGKYTDFNRVRYRSQVEWISDFEGNVRVKQLLAFENLAHDFNKFLSHIGIEPFPLLDRNSAYLNSNMERMPFESYYTSETTRQTVESIWADDFEMFNYKKFRSTRYNSIPEDA